MKKHMIQVGAIILLAILLAYGFGVADMTGNALLQEEEKEGWIIEIDGPCEPDTLHQQGVIPPDC